MQSNYFRSLCILLSLGLGFGLVPGGLPLLAAKEKAKEKKAKDGKLTEFRFGKQIIRLISRIPTREELKRMEGEHNARILDEIRDAIAADGLPDRFSMRRQMSPVKNQGPRGTCSVFAAIALIEAGSNLDLSEQCLAALSSNEDPGYIHQRLDWAIRKGLYREADCPYSSVRLNLPPLARPSISFSAAVEYLSVDTVPNLIRMKQLLSKGIPIGASIAITSNDWSRQLSSPWVIEQPEDKDNLCLNGGDCSWHAIVLTGYDDALEAFEFKNSWSTLWQDAGYAHLSYEAFLRSYEGYHANIVAIH